jgi:glycosyltransferase involved in cell wall biosynthesis
LPFGNADFVDTAAFAPDGRPKIYDAIMIARWDRFKHHQLMVDAFRILKRQGAAFRGLMFGHITDTNDRAAIVYKKRIVETIRAEGLPIDLPAADAMDNVASEKTKSSMAAWINASRVGLLLSKFEAINRFKMECLSCDVPMIICDDACWCVRKHMGQETGIVVARRADAVAKAILAVKDGAKFSPRDYILTNTGIDRAMAALQKAVDDLDAKMGLEPAPIARYDGRNDTLQWRGFIDFLSAEVAKPGP